MTFSDSEGGAFGLSGIVSEFGALWLLHHQVFDFG